MSQAQIVYEKAVDLMDDIIVVVGQSTHHPLMPLLNQLANVIEAYEFYTGFFEFSEG